MTDRSSEQSANLQDISDMPASPRGDLGFEDGPRQRHPGSDELEIDSISIKPKDDSGDESGNKPEIQIQEIELKRMEKAPATGLKNDDDENPTEEYPVAPPPEQDLEKFLNQIPPDWEFAEKHGRANLVVDREILELNPDDPNSYCPCCQQPHPEDEHFYPLCVDNLALGELGPGFPLFFEFIKYTCGLMVVLSIIYFLPCCLLMYNAYTKLQDGGLDDMDNVIALYSFGAFISNINERSLKFYSYEDRKEQMEIITVLVLLSVIVSLAYLVWMRLKLLRKSLILDIDAFTPSDFCLMGMNMSFEDCSVDGISAAIKEQIKEKYDIEGIQYVNPSYDIGEFYASSTKLGELQRLSALVDSYCSKNKLGIEEYSKLIKEEEPPLDLPKRSTGFLKSEPVDPEVITQELEETYAKIKDFEQSIEKGGESAKRFTGIVFIVFTKPSDCLKILRQQRDGFIVRFLKQVGGCCLKNQNKWIFERAPEPTDIFWENLSSGTLTRIWKSIVSYVKTIIVILCCLGIIIWFKQWKDNYIDSKAGMNLTFSEMGFVKFVSVLISLVVMIVNILLRFIIRQFSTKEVPETTTKQNVSVAMKLTIARFLNSSATILMVNHQPETWFEGGDLVYDASILIIILTFQTFIFGLLNLGGIAKTVKKFIEQGKGENSQLTQREANLVCEGAPIDVANVISNFMNLIMTCMFYSPIIPQAIPAALVGSILIYWITKYNLLRRHKMPEMFSDLMASFFANFLPWAIFAWAIGYAVFLGKIELAYNFLSELESKEDVLDKIVITAASSTRPYIALGVVILCLLAPIRSLLQKGIDLDEALDQDREYPDLCLTFVTDYDKENPLTVKKGQLRLLEMQKKTASETGNKEVVRMLEDRMMQVSAQGLFSQMQQYTAQNQVRKQAYLSGYNQFRRQTTYDRSLVQFDQSRIAKLHQMKIMQHMQQSIGQTRDKLNSAQRRSQYKQQSQLAAGAAASKIVSPTQAQHLAVIAMQMNYNRPPPVYHNSTTAMGQYLQSHLNQNYQQQFVATQPLQNLFPPQYPPAGPPMGMQPMAPGTQYPMGMPPMAMQPQGTLYQAGGMPPPNPYYQGQYPNGGHQTGNHAGHFAGRRN